MKKIKFTCPHCQAKLRVPTHLAGISAPCPKCGRKITAPTDFESIVDDEAPAKPKARPEADSAPQAVARSSAAPAAPEQPATTSAPAAPEPSLPPVPVPPPTAPSVMEAPMGEREAPLAAPPVSELPQPIPEPGPEPIIEETILTQPTEEAHPAVESALPQPPLEKTEPIQVRPLPGTMPEIRTEADGPLPRLDAERGLESPTGLEALISSPTAPGSPTKLQLPEPGDLTGEESPGDFILPPEETGTASSPTSSTDELILPAETGLPPEPVIPDLSDLDMSAPGIPMEELGEPPALAEENLEMPALEPESPTLKPEEPELPAETVDEINTSLPDLGFPIQTEESSQPDSLVSPEPAAPVQMDETPTFDSHAESPVEASMISLEQEEVQSGGLSRGSMENLLSEQPETGNTAPIQPLGQSQETAPVDDIESMFEAPPKPPEASPSAESQSLEEMFGEIPGDPGKKKLTNVVMLSMIGAVAIIAVVVVVLGINAAGGLKPQISSNQTNITPPPRISEIPPSAVIDSPATPPTDGLAEAPARIDPVAQERATENADGLNRSTTTLPGDTSQPVVLADETPPSKIETPAGGAPASRAPVDDAPALSFDERVQEIMNGSSASGEGMNIIGGESSNQPSPLDSLDETIARFESGANEVMEDSVSAVEGATGEAGTPGRSNYNPPASFPAPGPEDSPLGQTRDLLDAFLRAPDWQSRIRYTYQGESLRPAIEEYYKKWPVTSLDSYAPSLFQLEQDTSLGGPYWVYLVSLNDFDQGYPIIIRVEEGNLKVDWEIYSEFQDQHFAEFRKGAIASPHNFRLVIERVSDYFGSDRDRFTDLEDYLVYQINPPYGELSEFSEYAFVKKGTELAQELDKAAGLNDEPLAVILTIEQKVFPHGEKHFEITDYVTEGWFR